jgi:hypothetical protein
MNFIATPPGAFVLLSSCLLSSFISGNLINASEMPSSGISLWIVCCIVGLFLLILIGSPLELPSTVPIVVYLLILSSLCTASGFVYSAFKK